MKNNFNPQKYELCNRLSEKKVAEICLSLSTAKDIHYVYFPKNNRLRKKYMDRLLRRAEAYLRFIKAEACKRGSFEFLYDNGVVVVFKKNRFICFKVAEEMSTDKIIPSEAEHTLNQEGELNAEFR